MRQPEFTKGLWGFGEVAAHWGISRDGVKRLVLAGHLQAINIGGRKLVPLMELERCEQDGVGVPRLPRHKPEATREARG